MNKSLRLLVWFLLSTILVSSFLLTKQAFGAEQDYKTLSREYNTTFRNLLIRKIQTTIRNGMPVTLYLKTGSKVCGIFKGYNGYDESVWIREKEHWFQTGYGIDELEDISINVNR